MGLYDENDISLRGLGEVKNADFVFAELYTSLMLGIKIERLEEAVGQKVVLVSRKMLEEDDGNIIIAAAMEGKAAFLVPGDPLIATTHVNLRIKAKETGIKTRVIHGASIISAVVGLSGLQNYKFGRSVTIPFIAEGLAETPYNVIGRNLEAGLHTLCFLDIRAEKKQYMSIKEALKTLLAIEATKRKGLISKTRLVVGIARAGSTTVVVKAGPLNEVLSHDFGGPPHTLVFPSRLHFVEAEALIQLANAPRSIWELTK